MIPNFQSVQVFQVFISVLAVWIIKLCHSAYIRQKYWPPGPSGIPILGNALQLPIRLQHLQLAKWKETYGPIFSLNLAGQPAIVIGSHQVAIDLLNKRADIYSDRPRLIVTGEYLTGRMHFAFINYGKPCVVFQKSNWGPGTCNVSIRWLKFRRPAQEFLNVRMVKTYRPLQEYEAMSLVSDMLQDPQNWERNLFRSVQFVHLGG
ncbi:hypothetical protein VKT23_014549 [Stygiomarasmius scandens]|uniref:Cytochrome P450 n=1 Tax=Marasmiellus scandens TaxID=2682957 RepID=A0ABR1J3M1_9AGAR